MAYLSMNDVLDELILQEKNVFTLGDAARIMHKDNGYVSKMLASNRKVVRIERGKFFINKGKIWDLYEIASQLVFPSYISLFSAFQYYSVTEQIVKRFSVITLRRHRTIFVDNNTIEFIAIRRERFFGYTRDQNRYVAFLEKAIVDSIYLNTPPLSYVEEAFLAAFNRKKIEVDRLIDYSIEMKSKKVMKSVGHLLEMKGVKSKKLRGAIGDR